MNELAPTDVIIDDANSTMSRELVRAAASRDDVNVVAVVGGLRQVGDDQASGVYHWLLNHNSGRGQANMGVNHVTNSKELGGQYSGATVISLGGSAESTATSYGDDGQLPPLLVVTDAKRWQPRSSSEIPELVVSGYESQAQSPLEQPLYTPSARWCALLPFVTRFTSPHVQVVEAVSMTERNSLVDNGTGAETLADARAVSGGIITQPNLDKQPYGDTYALSGKLTVVPMLTRWIISDETFHETVLSTSSPVGNILTIHMTYTGNRPKKQAMEVVTELSATHELSYKPMVSTADLGNPTKCLVPIERIEGYNQTEGIVDGPRRVGLVAMMYYDADLFRAHRILDTAKLAASLA